MVRVCAASVLLYVCLIRHSCIDLDDSDSSDNESVSDDLSDLSDEADTDQSLNTCPPGVDTV